MKHRSKLLLFLLVLIIPVFVCAANYNQAVNNAKTYNKSLLTPERYLKSREGELVTTTEFLKTISSYNNGKRVMSSSYMFDGTPFWARKGIISEKEPFDTNSNSQAKTKVVETVKHDTQASGTGRFSDPWIFIDKYLVKVKTDGHGTVDGVNETSKYAVNGQVSFAVVPGDGYKYSRNTCGGSATFDGTNLIITNIDIDLNCMVYFIEAEDGRTLPQPKQWVESKVVTSQYRELTPPVPNTIIMLRDKGYFKSDKPDTRIGILTNIPYRKGWDFNGYKLDGHTFISNKGVFDSTTYGYITKSAELTFDINPKEYTITLKNGTDSFGGVSKIENVKYEHDIPTIESPGRKGYKFLGYTGKLENGTSGYFLRYNPSTGKAVASDNVWVMPNPNITSPELTAEWEVCPKGYYCPGDNKQYKCPDGYSTAGTGAKSCKECRYWDSCHTGENTCKPGCDTYCYNYSYVCGESCYHLYVLAHGGCYYRYCTGTSCGTRNCSNCHTGHNTCKGDWVYIKNENSCAVSSTVYTVNLDKNGGTGGTSSYTLTYYGEKPVAVIDNDKDKETLEIPTRAGYIFEGYYTSATGGSLIISKNYEYASNYDKNKDDYTNHEINNLIKTINGKITYLDLKKKIDPSGNTFTLYAHWTPCSTGSRCPGDNKEWYCEPGKYQNETGQSTCKECVKESYQSAYGQDKCIGCGSGSTTSGVAASVCDALCSNNNEFVVDWEEPSWSSDNSISGVCAIKSCITGYSIKNNQCVDSTPPTCTVTKSNTGTTSGVTTSVKCTDNESGCKSNNTTGETGLKSNKTYTVYDNTGNSGTCTVSVSSQLQKRTRTWGCTNYAKTCNCICNNPSGSMGVQSSDYACSSACYSWAQTYEVDGWCNWTTTCTSNGWSSWSSWSNASSCSASSSTECRYLYN